MGPPCRCRTHPGCVGQQSRTGSAEPLGQEAVLKCKVHASSCRQAGPAVTAASMLIAKLAVVDPAHLQSSSEKQSVFWGPLLGGEQRVLCELRGSITLGSSITRFEVVADLRNLNPADLPNFSA